MEATAPLAGAQPLALVLSPNGEVAGTVSLWVLVDRPDRDADRWIAIARAPAGKSPMPGPSVAEACGYAASVAETSDIGS